MKEAFRHAILPFVFAGLIWLLAGQALFVLIQRDTATGLNMMIQAQLKEVLASTDFFYLGQSLSDLSNSGRISCASAEILYPIQRPLMNLADDPSCREVLGEWSLSGLSSNFGATSRNGNRYAFTYRVLNQPLFLIALWTFRLFGLLALALGFAIFFQRKKLAGVREKARLEIAENRFRLAQQVAHDIRSPLSVLNAIADSLASGDPEKKELLSQASRRIGGIADDLLKADRGEIRNEAPENPASLPDRILSLVEEKKIEFAAKKLRFEIRDQISKDGMRALPISERDLTRSLSNLLNNAAEASPEGALVYTVLSSDHEALRLQVIDHGAGIPAELLEKVGKVRVSSKGQAGNGLGLMGLSRSLQACGGRMEIRSKEGLGTEVSLRIPFRSSLAD